MPELVLKLGDNVVQTYVFDKDIMGIGRSRDNDVVIENLSVSRNHARIRNQGGKFVLTDLNSANGTYVNGVKVTKTEIFDGDIISVGKHKLSFCNKPLSEEAKVADAFGQDRTMVVDRAPTPVLYVTEGKIKGTEFPVTKFETAIGKAQENDIVIGDDWFLSKKQAVIYRKGSEFEIHDLGGFRKTKVNGQPLNEPYLLKAGDVIELGNTRCVFQYTSEAAPSGRIPQEMSPEDSIFSSNGGFDLIQPARSMPLEATEREESAESYQVVVEGLPAEPAADAAPSAEEATSHPASAQPLQEVAMSASEPAAARSAATSTGGSQRRRKKDRLRDLAVSPTDENGSVYGSAPAPETAESPAPSEGAVSETAPPTGTANAGPVPDPQTEQSAGAMGDTPLPPLAEPAAPAPASATSSVPDSGPLRWSGEGMSDEEIAANEDLQKEVSLWELALRNRSAVIRRQAAKTLKKLTGRDYEI